MQSVVLVRFDQRKLHTLHIIILIIRYCWLLSFYKVKSKAGSIRLWYSHVVVSFDFRRFNRIIEFIYIVC